MDGTSRQLILNTFFKIIDGRKKSIFLLYIYRQTLSAHFHLSNRIYFIPVHSFIVRDRYHFWERGSSSISQMKSKSKMINGLHEGLGQDNQRDSNFLGVVFDVLGLSWSDKNPPCQLYFFKMLFIEILNNIAATSLRQFVPPVPCPMAYLSMWSKVAHWGSERKTR